MGKQWKQRQTLFWGAPKSLKPKSLGSNFCSAYGDCSREIKRHLLLGRKVMTNLDSILKSRDITLPTKVRLVKAMVFPVVMYGYESWTIKKAEHRRIDSFELWYWRRLLRFPLDCKEIQPVNPKGNQPWIFIGRADDAAEAPILWPPDVKSWLIRKDPNAGKNWRQEEMGAIADEMLGWHHWLDGYEFVQALGVGDGHGSLMCCSSWVPKSQTRLSDWTELIELYISKGYIYGYGNYTSVKILKKKTLYRLSLFLCVKMTSCIPNKPVSINWVSKWRHMWRRAAGKHNGCEAENNLCCCEPSRFRNHILS